MRIECCPLRSPASASNRLPGGTRRSSRLTAASSNRSLRRACRSNPAKRLTRSSLTRRLVSLSAKLLIIKRSLFRRWYSVKRNGFDELKWFVGVDLDDADVGLHDVDHEVGTLALQAPGKAAPLGGVRGVLRLGPVAVGR